ncbi:MAG: hypothetical protein M1530_01560 [Candidatus Marsarchaeota archaeon]|nr:hypothetical protein [Candidatus Marsarchaeota archaeon]
MAPLLFQLKYFQPPEGTAGLPFKEAEIAEPRMDGGWQLTPARLSSLLGGLSGENYLQRLQPQLRNLKELGPQQQADANKAIREFAGSRKLEDVQRAFLYELAAQTAPAAVSLQVEEDYMLPANAFRNKNGKYEDNNNNCRHYGFKLYYHVLEQALDPDLVKGLGRKIHGRPKRFDWQSSGLQNPSSRKWDTWSPARQELCWTGRPVFIAYSFDANDVEGILEALQPGDLIGVDHNVRPHRLKNGKKAYRPHVGVYAGDGQVISIGQPLYRDDLKEFVRRARTVKVYKLARRELQPPDTSHLLPDEQGRE